MTDDREKLTEAQAHHAADRLEQAARIYGGILARDPNHAGALHGLALVMMDGDLLDEALELAHGAIRSAPAVPAYHNSLGLLREARGETREAVADFEQAVALDPAFADAWANLGGALGRVGDHAGAAIAFGRAVAIRPDASLEALRGDAHRMMGRPDLARAAYGASLARDPASLDARMGLAQLDLAEGRTAEAASALRALAEQHPDEAATWSILGNALLAAGRQGEAVDAYRLALALEPNHAGTNANLGAALLALGRPDEARDACEVALRCRPEHAEAHLWLAVALMQLGRREDAASHARHAVELRPELDADPAFAPLRDLMF